MKKEYIFLVQIIIIGYLIFLIIDYKYKEYIINNHIEKTIKENEDKKLEIQEKILKKEYISTKAYKNKVLKEEQSLKNKKEVVINITNEEKYNKYIKINENIEIKNDNSTFQDSMTIYQKWVYFLLKKDIR